MNNLSIILVKKFDVNDVYIRLPKFYSNIRQETKISYLLLNFLYYNKYKTFLNVDEIYKNNNGKPFFENKNIFFNISHSKNYACCCLSTVNIGLDIEEKRVVKESVAYKFKNKNDNIKDNIYIWNLKEAYSKYLGVGLYLDFSSVSTYEIEKRVSVYNKKYNKLYLSICYDKNVDIEKNIYLVNKKDLMSFYYKFYKGSVNNET